MVLENSANVAYFAAFETERRFSIILVILFKFLLSIMDIAMLNWILNIGLLNVKNETLTGKHIHIKKLLDRLDNLM